MSSFQSPELVTILPYMAKEDFADVIQLRILRWGASPVRPSIITRILIRGSKRVKVRERRHTSPEVGEMRAKWKSALSQNTADRVA